MKKLNYIPKVGKKKFFSNTDSGVEKIHDS